MKATAFKRTVLALPTEKSVPVSMLEAFSIFIYGKQGIGKTSFTAQFPKAIHMMFEPGAKTESIFAVYPKNWEEVLEYTRMIKASDAYENVIIDTIDLMYDMIGKQVCKDNGVDFLKDVGFSDGYTQAGNKFRDILTELHSNKGLIMLAHDKTEFNMDENAPKFIIPSTASKGASTVGKWVDLTAHYYQDSAGNHQLRIRSSVDREAKNRIKKRFMYTDGSEMRDVYMGKSEFEAFENFKNAFENKTVNPAPPKSSGTTKRTLTLKKQK